MALSPTPVFMTDKNSVQFLFFTKFVEKLNKNYLALSIEAHKSMIEFMSEMCELFYEYQHSTEIIEQLDAERIGLLKEQLQEVSS